MTTTEISKSESEVFEFLKKLPKDCIIYSQPLIPSHNPNHKKFYRPDFVVILPQSGILVLEVKSWKASDIAHTYGTVNVELKEPTKLGIILHPLTQARNYLRALKIEFTKYAALKNGVCFASMAAFSNIAKDELSSISNLTNVEESFPQTETITKEAINANLSEEQILEILNNAFKEKSSLNQQQLDTLHAIFSPDSLIQADIAEDGTIDAVKVMDIVQSSIAKGINYSGTLGIHKGHWHLRGVAGSGKTRVLVARAKFLSEQDPSKRILITCYNRTLAGYLDYVSEYENITVCTFHKLWSANQLPQNPDTLPTNPDDFDASQLLNVIPEENKYDAILIDEAQDFLQNSTWLKCLPYFLKDRENGDLVIVGDGKQGIYQPYKPKQNSAGEILKTEDGKIIKEKITWLSLGIKAQGRISKLTKNYRNSREIVELAYALSQHFSDVSAGEEDIVEEMILHPELSIRNTGIKPLLTAGNSTVNLIEKFVSIIEDLRKGEFNGQKLERPLKEDEIAVLFPIEKYNMDKFQEALKKAGISYADGRNHKDNLMKEKGIKLLTIHSAKGLEFKAVLVFDIVHLLQYGYIDEQLKKHTDVAESFEAALAQAQSLLYVALTRAEDILVVGASTKDSVTPHSSLTLEQTMVLARTLYELSQQGLIKVHLD